MYFENDIKDYFFGELIEICSDEDRTPTDRLRLVNCLFKEVLDHAVYDENRYFSTPASKALFTADKFSFPGSLRDDMTLLRRKLSAFSSRKSHEPDSGEYAFCIATLGRIITFLADCELPDFLRAFEEKSAIQAFTATYADKSLIEFLRASVKAKLPPGDAYSAVEVETDEGETYPLRLYGELRDMSKCVRKGSPVNLFNVKLVKSSRGKYLSASSETLLVIEPDVLIDVTDISECFLHGGTNHFLRFLKKFSPKTVTPAMLLGNIVNTIFDELIGNPSADFDTTYDKAIKIKPLQLFALSAKDPVSVRALKDKARGYFGSLKKLLPFFKSGDYHTVEPSFISPLFGLQGRLDLMIEYDDDPQKKDIIELKSGKAPSADYSNRTPDGKFVQTGVWPNHFAQTTCYNLLLDSAFTDRTGNSGILYAGHDDRPLRNTPNDPKEKQKVLALRNRIAAREYALACGDYSLFKQIRSDTDLPVPPFASGEIDRFAATYDSMNDAERAYFTEFASFVQREIFCARLGSPDGRNSGGFSGLWRNSLREKELTGTVLSGLKLIPEESDFEGMKLKFRRPVDNTFLSGTRKGDIAILRSYSENDDDNIFSGRIIKCSVRDITPDTVTLSLRNKMIRIDASDPDLLWVVEPDYLESGYSAVFAGLMKAVTCDASKRSLLLGKRLPEFDDRPFEPAEYLSDEKNEILKKALSAKDYFLIQGPPGTGKTSYMLRALIEKLCSDPGETILVTAYTNRAVDEICSVIKRSEPRIPFIRLGNKESGEHEDVLISFEAERSGLKGLYAKLMTTRLIVSTVSSLLSNPEIFDIKKFTTTVIDEASQILEPQIIGLLTETDRFIMIGDEKQLPAVTLQPEFSSRARSEALESVGITKLSGSLFERLLEVSKSVGASAMLSVQARMHSDIQRFPGEKFYDGKLRPLPNIDRLFTTNSIYSPDSDNPLERLLSRSRVMFIDSKPEFGSKTHSGEARLTAEIAKLTARIKGTNFRESDFGAISPWRAQCAEIIKQLPEHLRGIITVDTVERFQGSERDIVVVSYAVNYAGRLSGVSSPTEIGGITVDRKLNVALTRARDNLIILAGKRILSPIPVFNDLIEYAESIGGYVESKEIESILSSL